MAGGAEELEGLGALGVRTREEADVERDVVASFERRLAREEQAKAEREERPTPKSLLRFVLEDSALERLVSPDGGEGTISHARVAYLVRILERSAQQKLRQAPQAGLGNALSRGEQLMIKVQILKRLLKLSEQQQQQQRLQQQQRQQQQRQQQQQQQSAPKAAIAAAAKSKPRGLGDQGVRAALSPTVQARGSLNNGAVVSNSRGVSSSSSSSLMDARNGHGARSATKTVTLKRKRGDEHGGSVLPKSTTKRKKKEKGSKKKKKKQKDPKEKHGRRERSASLEEESERGVECPICFRKFSENMIQGHAARCTGRSAPVAVVDVEAGSESEAEFEPSAKSDSDDEEEEDEQEDDDEAKGTGKKKGFRKEKRALKKEETDEIEELWNGTKANRRASHAVEDDFEKRAYLARVRRSDELDEIWSRAWQKAVDGGKTEEEADEEARDLEEQGAVALATATLEDESDEVDCVFVEVAGGLRVNRRVYCKLFDYQQEALEWFWKLHRQGSGGILGDEMGLGKTVQVGSFLATLKDNGLLRPSIIACPATTIGQWVSELNRWAPRLRVFVLHSSGAAISRAGWSKARMVEAVCSKGDVLVTTYEGLRQNQDLILGRRWGYLVLDEGHKIRNPDADITIVCKRFRTVHRIVMTGSPIQNNLRELWSLFDFVVPGKLGSLPMFESQFSVPINLGGYRSATTLQVRTAYSCAKILKETIDPHLLRRLKRDVATSLPKKLEHVLFCELTKPQLVAYKAFLRRPEVEQLIESSRHGISRKTTFKCIRSLQHICNHPDLFLAKLREAGNVFGDKGADSDMHISEFEADDDSSGAAAKWAAHTPMDKLVARSGKMMVLRIVLEKWKEKGHRVLVFSQGRLMLDILERFVDAQGYAYLRMDGTTPIKARAGLIDRFNDSQSPYFVFLLTTKVGGLGINLTGADRVVLFDPDWNPSTDMQARERAWRIGQKRDVTIYRLITSGTIEEKIYHRQIFKQYLSNKILEDARQKRFARFSNMRDLFTLGDPDDGDDEEAARKRRDRENFARRRKQAAKRKERSNGAASKSSNGAQALIRSVETTEANHDEDEEAAREAAEIVDTETSDMFSGAQLDAQEHNQQQDSDNILQALFDHGKQGGFRQALQHNVVEDAARNSPDRRILEDEAMRVARGAAEALRREQDAVRRNESNVHLPTWTGANGLAGRLGGVDSAEILQRLRSNNASQGGHESQVLALTDNTTDPNMQFLRRLQTFLAEGSRTSNQILQHFENHPVARTPELFRRLLREIAQARDGQWRLKPAYAGEGGAAP